MDMYVQKDILGAHENLMNNVAIMQHHDAITGTGRQRIADDYMNRMYKSMNFNHKTY